MSPVSRRPPLETISLVIKRWAAATARWHLNMVFYEDDSKICHDPENLSALGKIARDFTFPRLKLQKAIVPKAMEKAGLNPEFP